MDEGDCSRTVVMVVAMVMLDDDVGNATNAMLPKPIFGGCKASGRRKSLSATPDPHWNGGPQHLERMGTSVCDWCPEENGRAHTQ